MKKIVSFLVFLCAIIFIAHGTAVAETQTQRKGIIVLELPLQTKATVVVAIEDSEHTIKSAAITAEEPTEEPTLEPTPVLTEAPTTEPAEEPVEEPVAQPQYSEEDEEDIEYLAYSIWGEAGVVRSTTQRAAVAWVILNRVDDTEEMQRYTSIKEVVTAPDQVQGYYRHLGEAIPQEYLELARDVLNRYYAEKAGNEDVGRVIPSSYLFWKGNHSDMNYFTEVFTEGNLEWAVSIAWDWSMTSPYNN